MLVYFIRRLLLAAVTIWAITVVTFVIIQLPPGDFVDAYVAQSAAMGSAITMEEAAALRQAYGLDEPLLRGPIARELRARQIAQADAQTFCRMPGHRAAKSNLDVVCVRAEHKDVNRHGDW